MSTATRDWASQFAPPPPPPIARQSAPAEAPVEEAAEASAQEAAEQATKQGSEQTGEQAADAHTHADGPQDGAVESGADQAASPAEPGSEPTSPAGSRAVDDIVRTQMSEPGPGAAPADARPGPATAQTPQPAAHPGEGTAAVQQSVAPAPHAATTRPDSHPAVVRPTPSDEAAARPLLELLDSVGAPARLSAASRTERGRSFDLTMLDPTRTDVVLSLAAELAEAADAVQVLPTRGPAEGQVHLEVILPPEQGPARQTAVWVPIEVRDAINDQRSRNDESATAVFLEAFNNQYVNLSRLFPRRAMAVGPMPVSKARRRTSAVARTQLWLYLNAQQRDVLDTAVEDSGAGSRSALVTRILETELGLTPLP